MDDVINANDIATYRTIKWLTVFTLLNFSIKIKNGRMIKIGGKFKI